MTLKTLTLFIISGICLESQAARWANGGGEVADGAKVHASAFIGEGCRVGKNVQIGEGATLVRAQLDGDQALSVGPRAVLKDVTLAWGSVDADAVLTNVRVDDEIRAMENSVLSDVRAVKHPEAGGLLEVRPGAVVSETQVIGRVEIRDKAVVSKSKLTGRVEIRDRAVVSESELLSNTDVRDGVVVNKAKLPPNSRVER